MQSPSASHPLAHVSPVTDTRRSFAVFAVCLVAALWLLARPYIGLRHDGELYLGQMLLHWYPEILSQDLFFKFGSQDTYSIVSRFLAVFYGEIGVAQGQMLLIAATQIAVLLLVFDFLRRAGVDPLQRLLGMAALCVMSHNYGGWSILSFSERFITGRSFAEPFALYALFAVDRKQLVRAGLALLAAMLFHPLIGLPAVVVAWGMLVVRDRRWLAALAAAPVAFALAAAGVPPFATLLHTYDAEWWKAIGQSNGMVFVVRWPFVDWVAVLFDCGILWVAARVFPSMGTLLRVAAVVTGALLATSAVGADWMHNVLITQLQLWRVHWISHLLALPLLVILLWRTWRAGDVLAQTAVLAGAAAAVATNVRYAAEPGLVAWAAFAVCLLYTRPAISPRLLQVARGVTVAALVTIVALILRITAQQLFAARGAPDTSYILLLVATMPALSIPLALFFLNLHRRGGLPAAGVLALVVAGTVFGVMHWDQRPSWIRYIETHVRDEHPFAKLIPAQAEVLWWDETPAVWALLHRRSYFSSLQSGGLLFSRDTTEEFLRRGRIVGAIQLQRDVCDLMSGLQPGSVHEDCWPTMPAVEQACQAAGGPDFVIVSHPLARGVVAQWTFDASRNSHETFYLHDCQQIR
ncbi:hypothetical protein [Ramlibacter sp.]|uniref:hypothetical protein n=1 Tax=Ramlibacter sp. TaxID=1917967 RepID=UPI00263362BA|nr:hypothetical protein [Ramlibacter sp.]MDB5954970.1 hypothetical protein [Ramlibacter sp.]